MPVGYFAKEPFNPAAAEFLGPVEDVASVAECIVSGADDWIQHWAHNALWRFDSEKLALSVVPAEARDKFQLFAYEIYPCIFEAGDERPLNVPPLKVEPMGSAYEFLGYDVVVLSDMRRKDRENYEFGCSPLSCNSLLNEVPVNVHCLLDSRETAFELAKKVSASNGTMAEPGDYVVVRVFRKRK